MGFINSGHAFVNNLSLLLADLELLSEVDDILLEGSSKDEVLKKFELLLQRCRKYNIKISRQKVQYGEQVVFAGVTIGGKEGFRLTTAKVEGIINMSHPTNLTELRSFLGAYNQLQMYLPNFAHYGDTQGCTNGRGA